jgi:transposase
MKTQDARRLSPQAQEDLRRRVVSAIVRQGMTQAEAQRAFGVGRTTIYNWLKTYRARGSAALRSRKRGRPRGSRLAGHEAATVVRMITDRCPDQLKLPFMLWTREAVQHLIARRFRIDVSVWTVGRYLKRWGFTPQKPVRRAYERDPEAVRRWLQQEYPAIRQRARREKAEIYWADQMGLRSDHQAGRSYGLKGHTPVIPGTGQRFGCNMMSAITNRGKVAFRIFKGRFVAGVMIDFLRRLSGHASGKAFLIADGHPVHRSRKVRDWLDTHRRHIEMFLLPSYSPELNPDELLNQDVKSNALGRRRPQDQEEMVSDIRSYLWSTQRRPDIVRNYFQEEHVRYAAL